MKRREFLKTMTVTAGVPVAADSILASLPLASFAAEPGQPANTADTVRGEMRVRALGRTGPQARSSVCTMP
jgi:hypothetical protein